MQQSANKRPRVSVGLPVFNGARLVEPTIRSILAQDLADIELIIVDNASTDDTPAICRRIAASDSRVRYHGNSRNLGAPRNYNLAFERSEAPYFKWCAVGDICGPGLLSRCMERLEAEPSAVLAYPQTRLFAEQIEDFDEYEEAIDATLSRPAERYASLKQHLHLNNLMNGMIRRSALAETRLHRPFFSSDVVLMMELILRGPFVPVTGVYYYRRMAPESATALQSREQLVQHWSPERTHPLGLQRWRRLLAEYGAALRARIGLCDTAAILWMITRSAVWQRRQLWRELTRSFERAPQ